MAKKSFTKCSFCGRSKADTLLLIEGLEACICDDCVMHAEQILDAEMGGIQHTSKSKSTTPKLQLKPLDIKQHLDQYVIGQEDAKKVIAVAVYNHYKRLNQKVDKNDDVEIEKSNIIMAGQTGTGKTLIAKSVARLLNVPFAIVDATVFTEAGYVGEDVESIITRLLQVCDYDIQKAEQGIVFIDEIDKLSRKGDNPSLTRDVKEGTQQALLKLLEGTEVLVPPQGGRKHPEQTFLKVNTKNILFICGGSFDGMEAIIAKRLQTASIGFKKQEEKEIMDKENYLEFITQKDLRSFGLIPELIGRLPVLCHLNPLDKDALRDILTKPKNALIKQYQKLFEIEKINLAFDDEAIEFIIDKAFEYKLGARGLRSICEAIITDAMFELPSKEGINEFVIIKAYAEEKVNKSKISKLKVA